MAPADFPGTTLRVEVVYCPKPGLAEQVDLRMEAGATLTDALLASRLLERHGLSLQAVRVGIWGRVRDACTALRDRDRVEIYRPLLIDPKQARHQRDKRHREARQGDRA